MRKSELLRLQTAVQDDPYLTKEAIVKMQAELERLEKVDRKPAAEEVARTVAMGDLSENAAYQVAKGRLRGINSRILTLQERLKRAVTIKDGGADGLVHIGSTVTVKTTDKEVTYQILGSQESNPSKGYISRTSPLGSALLNHKVGETVQIQTPKGTAEYTITRVE